MRIGRRAAFGLCLLAFFAYEGYALFVQESGITAHVPRAADVHATGEVHAGAALTQTFVSHAEGFRGLEVYPRPSQQPPVGPLVAVVSMVNLTTGIGFTPMATRQFDAASIDLDAPLRITIPRIDYSGGLYMQIELSMPETPAGRGLRFAAGGPTYVEGFMTLGGRREWGDLAFRTEAQRTTVFRNIQRMRTVLGPILRTDAFWLTALILVNLAIATVLYHLAFAPEEDDAAGARQLPKGSVEGMADQPRV